MDGVGGVKWAWSHIRYVGCDEAGEATWGGRAGVRAATVIALLLFSGCATFPPLQIDTARTGETVVRVRSSRSFDDVAETVYGDPSFGPALAELAGLPYDDPIPRGELLILPPAEELQDRLALVRTAEAAFAEGLAAVDRGAYRAAADRFRAALDAAPHRADIRYNLGLALLKAGDPAAATPVLEEAARLRPDHADSRYAFGSVLRQRRAYDRALAEFRAAAGLDPDHAAAAYAIARTLEDEGELPDAKRAYRAFLLRFGNHELARGAQARLEALEHPPTPDTDPRNDIIAP